VEPRSSARHGLLPNQDSAKMPLKGDLVTGTLDLLVLKALQLGDAHGWAIMDRIRATSGDVLQVNQGSLYPAIYRLQREELIGSHWAVTENNRKARYYTLNVKGRERLAAERQEWARLSEAVNRVLSTRAV
jgi:PadR family transcriptional regulator, regulatory protein PadR